MISVFEWPVVRHYKLPGPYYVVYISVLLDSIIICRLYKLTFSQQVIQ